MRLAENRRRLKHSATDYGKISVNAFFAENMVKVFSLFLIKQSKSKPQAFMLYYQPVFKIHHYRTLHGKLQYKISLLVNPPSGIIL